MPINSCAYCSTNRHSLSFYWYEHSSKHLRDFEWFFIQFYPWHHRETFWRGLDRSGIRYQLERRKWGWIGWAQSVRLCRKSQFESGTNLRWNAITFAIKLAAAKALNFILLPRGLSPWNNSFSVHNNNLQILMVRRQWWSRRACSAVIGRKIRMSRGYSESDIPDKIFVAA